MADKGLRTEVHAYLGGISKRLDCQPVLIGGVEDHVHTLAALGKSTCQSEWVKELKRVSSIWMKERAPQFAWQGGYGAYSVGYEGVESVRRYIADQEEHHRKVTFEEEFLRLLEEHGMHWVARDSFDE